MVVAAAAAVVGRSRSGVVVGGAGRRLGWAMDGGVAVIVEEAAPLVQEESVRLQGCDEDRPQPRVFELI